MKAGGELEAWLKKAKSGRCPCGRRLPEGRTVLCARKECRTEYDRLTTRDRRGPTYLRTVTAHGAVEEKPRRVRLSLECGHTVDTYRSTAQPVGARVRCPTCQQQATVPDATDAAPPAPG